MPDELLHSGDDESAIVIKAKTDDASFEILYNKYFPKIYGYVMKRVGDHAEAEDIVSQAFIKVVEKLPEFEVKKDGTFKSWLYRIATNMMIDYFRKFGLRKTDSIDEHDSIQGSEQATTLAENNQNRDFVFQALSKLPENYQQILTMRFYGELEIEEIGAALSITVNNVSVTLHRALQKFEHYYTRLNQK